VLGQDLGPFRVLRELGKGGMGTVYLAEATSPTAGLAKGAQVAVKVVHPELFSDDPAFFKRFLREVDIGKAIDAEHVVRTYDAGSKHVGDAEFHYLVMEFVEGQTLRDLLDELDRVPEDLCRQIASDVCDALAAIHEAGIIHRDLKPENVLITKDQVVKVMDLGCAKLQEEAVKLSQTGQFVGSLLYAAPEQFLGGGAELDGRADLYALGLLLYELSTGRHPFRDDDISVVLRRQLQEDPRRPGDVNPQLSAFFEELVLQLLAKERDERLADAGTLREALAKGEQSAWWAERSAEIRQRTRRPLRRIRIPRETALYGRDTMLEEMRLAFLHVRQGEGRTLLIRGEAGVGKTRLVDEFVNVVLKEDADVNFLFGSRPPGSAPSPFAAFRTAFREHLGKSNLADDLAEYLPASAGLAPAFASFLKGDPAPAGAEPLTKETIASLFKQFAGELCKERPTIVLIEDLHAASGEELSLFTDLSLGLTSCPVLLVGTGRRGLSQQWETELERYAHVHAIQLERLGPDALQRLLQDALGSKRLADDLGAEIALKSDGKPFVVFEILRGLREDQLLRQHIDGSWISTSVIRKIDVPRSVGELVQVRIRELDEEDRELLEMAACVGFEFDPRLVAQALGRRRIPTLKAFGRLEDRSRMVRSAGDHYVFDQYQIHELLYEGLPAEKRAEFHAAIADELAERDEYDPEEAGGEQIYTLALHYLRGNQADEAREYFDRALDFLEQAGRCEAAVEFADLALALDGLLEGAERASVLLRKAHRLGTLGLRDEEGRALEFAVELADEVGEKALECRALRSLGWHLLSRSRLDAARTRLDEALALARADGLNDEEARITGLLGYLYAMRGMHEEALALYLQQLQFVRQAKDRKGESIVMGNLGVLLQSRGHYQEAKEHFERQLAVAREGHHETSEGVALLNLGRLQRVIGDTAAARATLEEARTLLHALGDLTPEGYALHRLGEVAEQEDEATEAEMLYEQALVLWREAQHTTGVVEALIALGRLLAARDRIPEAVRHLREAAELSRDIETPHRALAAAHLAHLRDGDAGAALEALRECGDRLAVYDAVEARFSLWRATKDPEHLKEARRMLAHLRNHAPEECRDTILLNVPLHREILAA